MNPPEIIQLIGVSTAAAATLLVVVGITVRLALMPLIRARRAPVAPAPDQARIEARMDALEEEVRHLGDSLGHLAAAAEFDARLRSTRDTEAPGLPGAAS